MPVLKLYTIAQLKRCQSIVGYDEKVFMAQNDETILQRLAQNAALDGVIYQMETDESLLKLIAQAESDAMSDGGEFVEESRLLEIERSDFLKNKAFPPELAEKAAQSWLAENAANDYSFLLNSDLKELLGVAGYRHCLWKLWKEKEKGERDLDQNECRAFGEVREALVPLLRKVKESPYQPRQDCLVGSYFCIFPVNKSKEIAKRLVSAIGYNADFGRIDDVSDEGFMISGSTKDVRITACFTEGEWKRGILLMLHEGGHGEQLFCVLFFPANTRSWPHLLRSYLPAESSNIALQN